MLRTGRRTFLRQLAAGAALASSRLGLRAAETTSPQPRTVVYKTVGDLQLEADVYRPEGSETQIVPVVVMIHGGALILGNRKLINHPLRDGLLQAGYAIVSIDYRLAPETKLPGILSDIEDAFRFVREEGPDRLRIDARRIGVIGDSAGGYLTLASGYRVQPRPAALVALYGYGELAGAWYSRPSEFYRQRPLVSRDEAYGGVGAGPLSDGSRQGNTRGKFYIYCRQQGLWPKEVTGFDPDTENPAYDRLCPLRNVTSEYPPTLMIHGTVDTDVPYEQSVLMERELTKHGVEHRLIAIENGDHGFRGGEKTKVDAAYNDALAFMRRHVPKSG